MNTLGMALIEQAADDEGAYRIYAKTADRDSC